MGTSTGLSFRLAVGLIAVVGCGPSDSPTGEPRLPDDAGSSEPIDRVQPSDAGGPMLPERDAGATAPTEEPTYRLDEVLTELSDPAATPSVLDGLLGEVARSDGWPLHDDGRYLFAIGWQDQARPESLVGDFNGWNTNVHPITMAGSGTHGYVLVSAEDFVGDARGAKYKWWYGGTDYRSAEESRTYTYDDFGAVSYVRPPVGQDYFQRFLGMATDYLPGGRTVRVYVPAGYSIEAAPAMRTLLLHDGQNVFGPEGPFGGWQVDRALRDGGYSDVLAVAVDNAPDRMDVYTHVPDAFGGIRGEGRAADYVRFLQEVVLPFVRTRYSVEASGSSLMIAGSSLGGLVSLYIALDYPSMAGCVGAMSPTLGWGAFGAADASGTLRAQWLTRGRTNVAVYLDSGGQVEGECIDSDRDGIVEDSNDRDNYCTTTQLRDTLSELGYTFDVDLFHWWEPAAAHNEAAWRARVPRALSACATSGWR